MSDHDAACYHQYRGNGVIHLQKSQAASSYGSNYGLFIAADGTQLKEVERRAEISDIGIMCTEGILKGNKNGGFVSADETVRKMLRFAGFYNERVAEGDRQYNIYFTLSDSANVSMNNVAPVIKEIADSCGIDQKNVIINDLYLQWVLQPSYEMIVVCGTLILGIVLFSVVVIYNIFQVGIAQKVQEYGKIKALGATRKQMKQLIFREGILLAVPSIPLGLLFGFLIAKVSFNWLVEQGNLVSSGIKNHQVPLFSLTIMLICIFCIVIAITHGQFELQLDYSRNYDEAYPENNLDTILTDNPLNDSMIEEIKSIPGVTDVMTREIVPVNLNGTRFPAAIVSKK